MQFVADNFPADKQDEAVAFLQRNGVEMRGFSKDAGALERQYKRTTFRFDQGPSVIAADSVVKTLGARESFDDSYQGLQVRYNGDQATMLIRGTIDDVKHRS